jgi:serine/threonine-protein kinase
VALAYQHVSATPVPPSQLSDESTPELDAITLKALAKDPADRFPNARAMLDALRALPPDPVRVESMTRSEDRKRTGPSSAVISDSERKAITESAAMSARAATVVDAPISTAIEGATEPRRTRGIPTGGLFLLSALLIGAATALWVVLMIPR